MPAVQLPACRPEPPVGREGQVVLVIVHAWFPVQPATVMLGGGPAGRLGRRAGCLPAQVGQDRQHPAVVFRRGQEAELGEQAPDVRFDGLG